MSHVQHLSACFRGAFINLLSCAHVDGRRRTYKWYKQHLGAPLYSGAKCTIIQVIFLLMLWKHNQGIEDTAFDILLRMLHSVILPIGNLLPPSFHLVKRICGIDDLSPYEYHACPCDLYRYPKIDRSEWPTHTNDHCTLCSRTRFIRACNGSLTPAKRFYYFGVPKVIHKLFGLPDWANERGKHRCASQGRIEPCNI